MKSSSKKLTKQPIYDQISDNPRQTIFKIFSLFPYQKMQNEPNLKSRRILASYCLKDSYGYGRRFLNWLRFYKRTQFFVGWAVPTRHIKQAVPMKSGFQIFTLCFMIFNLY
jgi:hypothetical protein